MASKRRRKTATLGSGSRQHAAKRDAAARDVRTLTTEMDSSLRAGDCRRAVQQWAGAAQAWGEFRAHHTAGGGSMSDVGINMMNNAYHHQRDRVLKTCVCSTPNLSGTRRRK